LHPYTLYKFFSTLRSILWRTILSFKSDGFKLTFQGREIDKVKKLTLPNYPSIIIANHQSHADSALITALLGQSRPLIFVASSEYWGKKWYRKFVGNFFVGFHLIGKGKEGWEDLLSLKPLIEKGVVPVIYPEGTRSKNGSLGEFKLGAFRLANESNAHILPLAISGTEILLPKNGKIKRTALAINAHQPILPSGNPEEQAELSANLISNLKDNTILQPQFGVTWRRISKLASSSFGIFFVFSWAFAEAFSWPFTAELPLILLLATVFSYKRTLVLSVATATGSVLGVYLHWFLASKNISIPTPLTTGRMFERATSDWGSPFYAGFSQMWNGIPVKVYAKTAGELSLSFFDVTLAMISRSFRIITVGFVSNYIARRMNRYLSPSLGIIQSYCLILYVILLTLIIRYWS